MYYDFSKGKIMKIPVFFNSNMVVNKEFESPSPKKPLEVVQEWQKNYADQIQLHDFLPVSKEDFYMAHSKEHVEGIFNLTIKNGMDTLDEEFNQSLYWTTGSFLAATQQALNTGIAVSPTSGFHHAGYDYSWGFCTFNGLLVTAQKMLQEKKVKKIGILDFDYHQGDGSQDIIEKLNLKEKIVHITGKTDYERKKAKFFNQLPQLLEKLKEVDIIFYQAGADQHEKDPLGGFLNDGELGQRDKVVFEFTKRHQIPIVWNLAGGYQESKNQDGSRNIQKVLDIHNTTLKECIAQYIQG